MKFVGDMTIERRLYTGGGLLIVLAAIFSALVWSNLAAINQGQNLALSMQKGAAQLQLMMRGLTESAMTQGARASVDMTRQAIRDFSHLYKELIPLAQDYEDVHGFLTGEWQTNWESVIPRVETFLSHSDSIDFDDVNQMVEIGRLSADAGTLADQLNERVESVMPGIERHITSANSILFMVVLLVILVALLATVFISRAVLAPLVRTVRALDDIAEGEGDLTCRLEVRGNDELAQLGSAFNRFAGKMQNVLCTVRDAASSISTATKEIAAGNNNLAQRTEEQASYLEETASSMEEMTAAVRQSTYNANDAKQIADANRSRAVNGSHVVSRAIEAMDEINVSSKRIADIIGTIDGIAFQTNLLALNAAVEAARAGE